MLKIYQLYLIKNYLSKFFYISIIFFLLSYILNIFDEISFFKDLDSNILYPYYLTLLNTPMTLFEIFPFIFLLSAQFFFYDFFKNDELILLKNNGLKEIKIANLLFILSIIMGIIFIIFYYNLASNLQFQYSKIKNNFSNDNKYLAMFTDSGLWIKDEINNKSYIINSKKIKNEFLIDTNINEFNLEFDLIRTLKVKKINAKTNSWILYNPISITKDNKKEAFDQILLKTNFNEEKIKTYFSNMRTLNLYNLLSLKDEYKKLGYSTDDLIIQLLKILTTPILYGLMTIVSSMIMLNSNKKKSLINYLIVGIFFSAIIYYVNFVFNSLGNTGKIPIFLSIFFPLFLLSLISIIGIIRVNEK